MPVQMPPIGSPTVNATVRYRIARTDAEFEQIFRLNHATFAVELPQHARRADGRLIDRFHAQNTYVIGCAGERVVAMIAFRAERPFSLDAKVADLDRYLLPAREPCELRLLAIDRGWRVPGVFRGLLRACIAELLDRDFDLALISGTLRQQRLYGRLGFLPFAQPVGIAPALFLPMQLPLSRAIAMKPELFGGTTSDPS